MALLMPAGLGAGVCSSCAPGALGRDPSQQTQGPEAAHPDTALAIPLVERQMPCHQEGQSLWQLQKAPHEALVTAVGSVLGDRNDDLRPRISHVTWKCTMTSPVQPRLSISVSPLPGQLGHTHRHTYIVALAVSWCQATLEYSHCTFKMSLMSCSVLTARPKVEMPLSCADGKAAKS